VVSDRVSGQRSKLYNILAERQLIRYYDSLTEQGRKEVSSSIHDVVHGYTGLTADAVRELREKEGIQLDYFPSFEESWTGYVDHNLPHIIVFWLLSFALTGLTYFFFRARPCLFLVPVSDKPSKLVMPLAGLFGATDEDKRIGRELVSPHEDLLDREIRGWLRKVLTGDANVACTIIRGDCNFARYATLAEGCDAIVIITDWNEFKHLDMVRLKTLMRQPIVVDGRNIYEPETMKAIGFTYRGMGRGYDG